MNPMVIEFDNAAGRGQLFCRAAGSKAGGKVTSVIASTPAPDRASDIVAQNWILGPYLKNAVVMFAHKYDQPPVGPAIPSSVEVRDGVLRMDIEWDDSPENELGRLMRSPYERGYMSGVSVGFRPTSVTSRSSFPESDSRHGDRGFYFDAPELLELSAAPVPMNSQALAAKAFGALARQGASSRDVAYARGAAGWPPVDSEYYGVSESLLDQICPSPTLLSDVLRDSPPDRSASARRELEGIGESIRDLIRGLDRMLEARGGKPRDTTLLADVLRSGK